MVHEFYFVYKHACFNSDVHYTMYIKSIMIIIVYNTSLTLVNLAPIFEVVLMNACMNIYTV